MKTIIHINHRTIKWSLMMQNQAHILILMQDIIIKIVIENNDKDPKVEAVEHVRISKYKNIFANGYTPNWSEDVKKKQVKGKMLKS